MAVHKAQSLRCASSRSRCGVLEYASLRATRAPWPWAFFTAITNLVRAWSAGL